MKRICLAIVALFFASSALAQTANYPGTLYTYTAPVGACTPPSVTTGCITNLMFNQLAKEMQAVQATLDVVLGSGLPPSGLNNKKYTLLTTSDKARLGIDINTTTPATAALNIGQYAADPSSLANGDIWVRNGGLLKIRSGGTTYTLQSGASVFTGLTDVPASYFGESLRAVRVNAAETGLEFYTPAAGTGTVTSVAMTVPSILSIGGSPITTNGTLALTLANETANTIFAGPTTGSPAAPTFRALVDADIPSAIARDSEINVQGTSNEISSSGSGVAPTLSIASTFRIGGKTHTAPTTVGTTPPATCAVGDLHFDSDATAGNNVYGCTSTDTWTLEGDGGGGGSGDITDVWGCTSGNCNALTAASGDTLDATNADSVVPCKAGTSPPGTCTPPQCFIDTDATATSRFLLCTSTNTWTAQGSAGGNPVYNVLSKSSSYTILSGDITGLGAFIKCSTSSAAVPLTLPAANAVAGGVVVVKRLGANTCTVTAAGSDTIYDTSAITVKSLTSDGMTLEFVADGTSQWELQ